MPALPSRAHHTLRSFVHVGDPMSTFPWRLRSTIGTVVRQTDFDVGIGQYVMWDRTLLYAILIRHTTLSDSEVKVCPLLWPFVSHCCVTVFNGGSWPFREAPEGKPGMSDVSPLSGTSGLSFDSTLLSPLLFFCLFLLTFLSYPFLPAGPFFWTFSEKIFSIFR